MTPDLAILYPRVHRPAKSIPLVLAGAFGIVITAAGLGWWFLPGRNASDGIMSHGGAIPSPQPVWFEDVAEQVGVHFTQYGAPVVRYWFPELMGGGVALFDYDNDGDLDLYLVQGGDLDPGATQQPSNQLFRNRGDGTFEDVTADAGVGDIGFGQGCACADYDADGDIDLYVTNFGPNVLYRNNGDGTFTDVTPTAKVGDPDWSTSAAFLDYDRDGDLDIFVVNYIIWSIQTELKCYAQTSIQDYCKPANYNAPAPDTLYRNDGNDTFVNVSESAGLRSAFGNGLGVCTSDFNSDGSVDIYVANDGNPNQLWLNDGLGGFTDDALLAGCSVNRQGAAEAGMGVAAVDIDNDGDLDLFMTHLRNETNTLYVNNHGMFDDMTSARGLARVSAPYTGFGMGFADFDHDGQLDLYIANGKVGRGPPQLDPDNPYGELNLLLAGRGNGQFVEILPTGGTAKPLIGTSRGTAFGDWDNDGDVDVVVVEWGGPVRMLLNLAGPRGHWVMFRVLNEFGLDAVGAMVELHAEGRTQFRPVQTAYSYCASNDPRVHFGLGGCTRIDYIRVRWLNGRIEDFENIDINRIHEMRYGAGRLLPTPTTP